MQRFCFSVVLFAAMAVSLDAWGHGFTVTKTGTSLSVVSDDPTYNSTLFASDATIASGAAVNINHPSFAPFGFAAGDTLSFEVNEFLLWNGSATTPTFNPAPAGTALTMTHRFLTGSNSPANNPLVVTGSTVNQLGFDLMTITPGGTLPFSNHEANYAMPAGTPDGVYVLGLTVLGRDAGGNAFTPTQPAYALINIGIDPTTYDTAQQLFAATLVPEPATALLGLGSLAGLAAFRRLRKRGRYEAQPAAFTG